MILFNVCCSEKVMFLLTLGVFQSLLHNCFIFVNILGSGVSSGCKSNDFMA